MTATPYSASTAPFDSQLPVPSRPSRSAWPWWLMTIMSGGTAISAAYYFLGRPTGHFGDHFPILRAHITGGSVALLLGPWQFSTKLRERALNLHRWLGRIYLAAVALGSLAGFTLAFFSEEGPPTRFGFWRSCPTVVRRRADSIPANSSRQHRIAPPVDGSQLRAHSCRGYAAQRVASDACRAHAVLACLRDCVMALLGSEPARRRMASASPSEPREPLLARKGFLDPKLKAIFRSHVCS